MELGRLLLVRYSADISPTFCWTVPVVRCITRRVARIWKRGGLFWKSEKCANDLDSNFHWPWISFRRFVQNLRRNVSERSEIQRFFPPKIRWSAKKKKKRSSPKFRAIFLPKFCKFKRLRGALFVWGGYFPFFTENRPQKHKKHAILHTSQPNGGARAPPPPPGYATVYHTE